jgi:hypothetical protein
MSYKYSTAYAENEKAVYSANDNIDFNIVGDAGMSLLKNMTRYGGNLTIKNNAGQVVAEKIFFNEKAGVHGLFESFQVSTQERGLIENLPHSYPRFNVHREVATQSKNDTLQGNSAVSLKFPWSAPSQMVSQGIKSPTDQAGSLINDPVSFSVKPNICINRVVSEGNIPFDKVRVITVSCILARNLSFLYGIDPAYVCTYEISNLNMTYVQVPTQQIDYQPVICRSFIPSKQTFSSNKLSLNSKVPGMVDSVSMSFQEAVNENSATHDNCSMDIPDGLESIEFLFNNSVEGVEYVLEDQDDMVSKFIKSFGGNGHNDAYRTSKSNKFGVGLNFELNRDLRSNTFNTIVNTNGVNNNNKYNIYIFFQTSVEL